MVEVGDYPEVFQAAFADRIVRRRELPGAHSTSSANWKRG